MGGTDAVEPMWQIPLYYIYMYICQLHEVVGHLAEGNGAKVTNAKIQGKKGMMGGADTVEPIGKLAG